MSAVETSFRRDGALPLLGSSTRAVPISHLRIKRAIDLVVATAGLIVTAPILLVAMAAIVAVTGSGAIFRQERVGLNGRRFRMYKLRTMVPDAHELRDGLWHLNEADGPAFKIKRDPRLHSLGSFLRCTSIDELPNFVNVLLGDMSIVGPRPSLPEEVEHYDPHALRRLTVTPGVTCLWQISGRSGMTFEQWMELDNEYIDTWTPLGDLAIIARTIPAVIRGVGAY